MAGINDTGDSFSLVIYHLAYTSNLKTSVHVFENFLTQKFSNFLLVSATPVLTFNFDLP
jgi:hypothetical protein